jgi:hypothetical protein
MLVALAERTGVELAQLRAMTLGGWVPWLFDTLPLRQWDTQTTFDTYVRENSVLLAPGEAGTTQVSRWKRWGGPWFPESLAPPGVSGLRRRPGSGQGPGVVTATHDRLSRPRLPPRGRPGR